MLSDKQRTVIIIMTFIGMPAYIFAFVEKSLTGLLVFIDIFVLSMSYLFHTKKSISYVMVVLLAYCNFYYFTTLAGITLYHKSAMGTMKVASFISAAILFVIMLIKTSTSEELTSQKIMGAFFFLICIIGLIGKLVK